MALPGFGILDFETAGDLRSQPGVPARDLTAEEVATWISKAQYQEMLASGAYSVADDKPAAKEDK